ncbi:MAG: transporter [Nitrospirae bacterium]|nr:transporter [Nitrospirota bacterium]
MGYTLVANKKDPNLVDYYFYGGALDWECSKPLHFVIEFNGNKNPDKTQVEQRMALGGFIYEVSKHLSIDATFKKGFSDSTPNWGIGIGAAIEF